MTPQLSVLNDVADAIATGSTECRSTLLRHVTDLFVVGADHYSDEEIALFDDVFNRLVTEIETSARALLAIRLAPIPRAPSKIICRLAFDEAIEVAGPVLGQSQRLDDPTLVENAKTMGQEHLLAISRRQTLSEPVTDVLVARGDRQIVLSTAENPGAKFSEVGFRILVQRSSRDDRLAISVGGRPDIPPQLFFDLLRKASDHVRAKLEADHPHARREVHQVVGEVADRIQAEAVEQLLGSIDVPTSVKTLYQSGQLNDERIRAFAEEHRVQETAAALALMCRLSLRFVARQLAQAHGETVLVLARASGLSWPTARAILQVPVGKGMITPSEIAKCLAGFERLNRATAQKIVGFYQAQEQGERRKLS